MSDIKKLWLNDDDISKIERQMGRPGFASTWAYSVISDLLKDRASLITTIESLQAEVKKHKWEDEQFSWLQEQIKTCASENTELKSQIESQKEEIEKYRREAMNERELGESIVAERERLYAITELAVKELSWYAESNIKDIFDDMGDRARSTLSEIASLQNET